MYESGRYFRIRRHSYMDGLTAASITLVGVTAVIDETYLLAVFVKFINLQPRIVEAI